MASRKPSFCLFGSTGSFPLSLLPSPAPLSGTLKCDDDDDDDDEGGGDEGLGEEDDDGTDAVSCDA
jgi:hypothetical protein